MTSRIGYFRPRGVGGNYKAMGTLEVVSTELIAVGYTSRLSVSKNSSASKFSGLFLSTNPNSNSHSVFTQLIKKSLKDTSVNLLLWVDFFHVNVTDIQKLSGKQELFFTPTDTEIIENVAQRTLSQAFLLFLIKGVLHDNPEN